MQLKVKKLRDDAQIDPPSYVGDAGYDVYSTINFILKPSERLDVPLGIAIEFSDEYVCLVQSKSGVARKHGLDTIGNVIDSGYRGEIHAQVVNTSDRLVMINKGMKIAQIIFIKISRPVIEFVEELDESDRGKNCFGSTGE